MKPIPPLAEVPIDETDNLDEAVLGAAALSEVESLPPEVDRQTADLTSWDEPVNASGTRAPKTGVDEEESNTGDLVESGILEADREQRMAADDLDI